MKASPSSVFSRLFRDSKMRQLRSPSPNGEMICLSTRESINSIREDKPINSYFKPRSPGFQPKIASIDLRIQTSPVRTLHKRISHMFSPQSVKKIITSKISMQLNAFQYTEENTLLEKDVIRRNQEWIRQRIEKIGALKKEKERAALQGCTFKPNISRLLVVDSEIIVSSPKLVRSYTDLYRERIIYAALKKYQNRVR